MGFGVFKLVKRFPKMVNIGSEEIFFILNLKLLLGLFTNQHFCFGEFFDIKRDHSFLWVSFIFQAFDFQPTSFGFTRYVL